MSLLFDVNKFDEKQLLCGLNGSALFLLIVGDPDPHSTATRLTAQAEKMLEEAVLSYNAATIDGNYLRAWKSTSISIA